MIRFHLQFHISLYYFRQDIMLLNLSLQNWFVLNYNVALFYTFYMYVVIGADFLEILGEAGVTEIEYW